MALQGVFTKFCILLRHLEGFEGRCLKHQGKEKPCLGCWQGVEGGVQCLCVSFHQSFYLHLPEGLASRCVKPCFVQVVGQLL